MGGAARKERPDAGSPVGRRGKRAGEKSQKGRGDFKGQKLLPH